jgi:hypothetical protein
MKKVMVCLLILTFSMSLMAFAQQEGMSQNQTDQTSAKAPLMTLKGTVKAEGEKYTFVNDKDKKSWEVMNPEEQIVVAFLPPASPRIGRFFLVAVWRVLRSSAC